MVQICYMNTHIYFSLSAWACNHMLDFFFQSCACGTVSFLHNCTVILQTVHYCLRNHTSTFALLLLHVQAGLKLCTKQTALVLLSVFVVIHRWMLAALNLNLKTSPFYNLSLGVFWNLTSLPVEHHASYKVWHAKMLNRHPITPNRCFISQQAEARPQPVCKRPNLRVVKYFSSALICLFYPATAASCVCYWRRRGH